MVSLINFKIVDDDLRCEGDGELVAAAASAAANATASRDGHRRVANSGTPVVASDRQARLLCQSTSDHDALQRRMPRTDNSERIQVSTSSECQQLQQLELTTSSRPTTREKARQTEVANIDRQQECNEMYLKCSCKVAHQQYQDSQHTITSSEHSSRLDHCQQADQCQNYDCHCTSRPSTVFGCNDSGAYESPSNIKHNQDFAHQKAKGSSFTVTWRNLKFAIEPKWHEKIAKKSSSIVALATCRVASTTSKTGPVEGANATEVQITAPTSDSDSSPVSRVVLDQLDGSFRSGQLTAILGPSGAGKTTLLDCLTGHRKSGLSGSIKFTSSRCSDLHQAPCCYIDQVEPHNNSNKQENLILAQTTRHFAKQHQHHNQHRRYEQKAGRKSPSGLGAVANGGGTNLNGDNLKVSIIPQNDHLIGHLSVYETLNYASKMKNCFEGEFNHRLNVRRVAEQLGLMSCLETRINKLSGGQYKRVSIAQELLSSPDVLILDEPTSGLDAMTCYQTVQVLKQLTEERQTSGQKSIAVILTIHQPNSDVFQQFDHVYVVAQGGKCIYEGPPGNIESIINRVGLCLPSSYYNPATMIVEIAAGKFGQEAICKLNTIQKQQYSSESIVSVDEQNSTGDSAVDCPSTSSSSSNYDEDENGTNISNKTKLKPLTTEVNNNNDDEDGAMKDSIKAGGLINEGFIMDAELDGNNNSKAEAVDKLCGNNSAHDDEIALKLPGAGCANQQSSSDKLQDRRKKRRRTRRRASEMTPTTNIQISKSKQSAIRIMIGSGDGGAGDGNGSDSGGGGGGGGGRTEKRLKLNSLKADQKFPFWRHTYLHFHRSWLSIVRDPMLCSMQLALHIIVPVMVSLVYGTYVGKPNACPRAGPIDIMAYALEPTDTALQLQEDLRTTLENIGYIFFKLYGIIFAAMTVTVLTFPLDMHVLVKEFRNGWYGLSSYFLGRTLADIPFQLTLPLLAMSLSYYATGQPYSYMQWRFFSITAILILSSLIAQSQGLLFGAILMDKMKAAVFVAPAATTPIILFAGFLVRTQSIPRYLRPLSNLSYLRYAIEACLISRYGFNQCECDPAIFNQTVPELPPIARSMLDYWLSSFKPPGASDSTTTMESLGSSNSSLVETTTVEMATSKPDLFNKLIDSLARANSFGRNITSCEQVVPYPMIDYDLKDSQLFTCFAILLSMLIFTRLLTFFIVCFKVKRKV